MDSPSDTFAGQQFLGSPRDDSGFTTAVTNMLERVSNSLGFGYAPNKVYSVKWSDYGSEDLVHSDGMLHLAALPDDSSIPKKYTHEVILYDPEQGEIAFSLLRTQTFDESQTKVAQFSMIFPCLVESRVKEIYSPSIMQKILDETTEWPSYNPSHIAVKLGLCEVLKLDAFKSMLEKPESKCGYYPIHIAVQMGNERVIDTLIECGVSLEVTDHSGNTPMHLAASKNVSVIQALLALHKKTRKALYLNLKNSRSESPLSLAAKAGSLENIRKLILSGANLNQDDEINPLFNTGPYLEKLKVLVASREISQSDLKLGGTLLHWAKSRTVISAAVECGCRLEGLNANRETALHVMVRRGNMACVVMLLSLGANPNKVDKEGNAPLHLAAQGFSVPLMQALISFEADVNVRNNKKQSARHVAASASVDERRAAEREKAIFALHAVGAKRCSDKLATCTEGCILGGHSNGTPLTTGSRLRRSRWVFDECLTRSQVTEAIKEQTKNPPQVQGRVLCLDGGGIKGLVLCQIMSVIEEFVGVPIYECFDWITGTSTGAFFALNLALCRPISHTQMTYYSLKDKIFIGSRPYNSLPLEAILQKEFGHDAVMSSIKNVKVNVPTTMADRIPADQHIFRNYEAPIDIFGIQQSDKFMIPPTADKQPIWQAARASGAAPTFFSQPHFGQYTDGGLIANNPTLDTLTEIEERNLALKATGREGEMFHPTVVVSIGCGRYQTAQIDSSDVVMPGLMDVAKSVSAVSNMVYMMLDRVTSTEERTVDRARAWCSSQNIPYFRFNPNLSRPCSLDEVNDDNLVQMMWEARSFMLVQSDLMEQLKGLIVKSEKSSE